MAGDVKSRPQACRRPASSPEFLCPSGEGESVMGDADRPRRGILMAREGEMDQPPKRLCPKCGGGNHAFRSRRQIEATAEKPAELETKFRCKGCENEWKERVPGVLRKARHRSRNWLVVHSVLNAFLARVECMDEKAVTNAVFRRAVRAYLIGAGIAIAVAVLLSLGAPLLPLPFAYRLAVLFGGVVTYSAINAKRPNSGSKRPGKKTRGWGRLDGRRSRAFALSSC